MKRGGWWLPWATASRHPIFSRRMAGGSSTVTRKRRVALAEGARLLGEEQGRAHIGGEVGQITLQVGGGGHRGALPEAALRRAHLAYRSCEYLLQRGGRRFLPGLEVIDAVERRRR